MLKMLISFSHSDFLPFFSWCFTVAKEMEFSGFGLELAVKLLKSLQSSSWNEWLLLIARSCSFINYLGFYHDPAQLIVLTNGVPSVSVLWLHCGRSLLISNAAGQWKWKKLVSGWYLPRPWMVQNALLTQQMEFTALILWLVLFNAGIPITLNVWELSFQSSFTIKLLLDKLPLIPGLCNLVGINGGWCQSLLRGEGKAQTFWTGN